MPRVTAYEPKLTFSAENPNWYFCICVELGVPWIYLCSLYLGNALLIPCCVLNNSFVEVESTYRKTHPLKVCVSVVFSVFRVAQLSVPPPCSCDQAGAPSTPQSRRLHCNFVPRPHFTLCNSARCSLLTCLAWTALLLLSSWGALGGPPLRFRSTQCPLSTVQYVGTLCVPLSPA